MLVGYQGNRNLGLDLVRSLAIVLVLVTHWGGAIAWSLGGTLPTSVMLAGFFGVELFFALSGFLIGQLLLDLAEKDPSLGGWWRFMVRRWLRTLPLYLLCLSVLALTTAPAGNLSTYLIRYGTLTQNLLWPMPTDNWFGVSWSLSVEEWFYLLFSLVLIGGVSLTKRRRLCTWVVIALFVIIPTALRWMVPDSAEWDTHLRKIALLRLDAIAYGVIMAALLRSGNPIIKRPMPLFAVGVGAIAYQWVLGLVPDGALPERLARTLSLSIAPFCFALCLPAAIRIQRMPALLAWAARRLSAQSYALYLVHLPLIDAIFSARAQLGWPAMACIFASAISIFGLSYVLHRWFEAPIMALRPKQYVRRDFVPEPASVSTV